MGTATPQIYRPSGTQRTLAGLLCVGSWLVGTRALALLIDRFPDLLRELQLARYMGEPVAWKWTLLVTSVGACVAGGILLLLSILAFLLVEGTHVAVDDMGIGVTCGTLPAFLARRLGAGRLGWKEISALDKAGPFFTLRGGGEAASMEGPTLRFLLVDNLEMLIHQVLERSPNLRWRDGD